MSVGVTAENLANLPPAPSEFANQVFALEAGNLETFNADTASGIGGVSGQGFCTIPQSTSVFPYAAVAFLKINIGNGSFRGSGFFVTDRLIVTAGHCVKSRLGTIDSIDVFPALNGQPTSPAITTTLFRPSDDYVNDPTDAANDFGAVFLPAGSGSVVFGFDFVGDEILRSRANHLQGYPNGDTRQRFCTGPVVGISGPLFSYDIPTDEGESGGPVWPDDPMRAIAAGIHLGHINGQPTARRVDATVLSEISRW